jgi:hypothetical protein
LHECGTEGAEIRFLMSVPGYICTLHYHKRNAEIRKEPNKYNLNQIDVDHKCQRIKHLLSINDTRIPYLGYE